MCAYMAHCHAHKYKPFGHVMDARPASAKALDRSSALALALDRLSAVAFTAAAQDDECW